MIPEFETEISSGQASRGAAAVGIHTFIVVSFMYFAIYLYTCLNIEKYVYRMRELCVY